jgi:hypothetical protein
MDTRAASSHEHETLEASASLAFQIAPRLCRAVDERDSCSWLHAFWPCLRLIGLAATPDRHAAFYGEALSLSRPATPRILISGAADQGMLTLVLATLPRAHITLIDACETPLHLNRWYAQRLGAEIETQRCSILDYESLQPFDAICTHSFFGQFSSIDRPRLMAAWHRLLRAGGRVITAHPLRPCGADEPNRFALGQAEVFRQRISAEASRLAGLLKTGPAEVVRLGEAYLRARYGYPVRSTEELAILFSNAGFEIDRLECKAPAADAPMESGGPGLRNPAVQYAHVIALR